MNGKQNMTWNGELPLDHKLSKFQAAHGAPKSKD